MNALDFVTKSEFNKAKELFDKRKKFYIYKKIKTKNMNVEINIYGDLLNKETEIDIINDVWNGEDYLVHISENHHFPNDIGGHGWAEKYNDFKKYFDSFDAFLGLVDSLIKKFPNFEQSQFQLNFFEE